MNSLNEFFDVKRFFEGKKFSVCSISKWTDYSNKDLVLGSLIGCVIVEDKTVYADPSKTNKYEKIYFRIPMNMELVTKYISIDKEIVPVVGKCRLSGRSNVGSEFVNYSLQIECIGFNDASGKKII